MSDKISGLTRRGLAAGAGALALQGCVAREAPPRPLASRQFPPDFLWGVATAAYQTEGALEADGRGASIWDVFAANPSNIHDRSNAATACDSYRRYGEDAALARAGGLNAFRFSIAWPRVQPLGAGPANVLGLDHYARVVDGMLEAGLTPFATLYHWDLPQTLQAAGGWANRDTAARFADYADIVARRLGDRLARYVVLNEAAVHTVLGHVTGLHAPGLRDGDLLGPVTHHLNLAQGRAIAALRAARPGLVVGTTLALMPSRPAGGALALWNRLPAAGFDELWNGAYLDPLLHGTYPEQAQSLVAASVRDGDMAAIHQGVDFIGVNYYAPTYMRLDLNNPSFVNIGAPPRDAPKDAFGRHIDPSGLGEMLARLRTRYANPNVLITENGCSDPFSDGPALIEDEFRIAYVRAHLEAVKREMEAGARIGGYFHWTLIDNWEWAEGYRSKFGLVAMDRATGVRTPKRSHQWFAALARSGLLDES